MAYCLDMSYIEQIDDMDDMDAMSAGNFKNLNLFSKINHWNANENAFLNNMQSQMRAIQLQQKNWSERDLQKKRIYAVAIITRVWNAYRS